MVLSRPIEPPDTRNRSPSGGSTLITSAPMSAKCWVANGPSSTAVRSITFTPASGPGIVPLPHSQHVAVGDLLLFLWRQHGDRDGSPSHLARHQHAERDNGIGAPQHNRRWCIAC